MMRGFILPFCLFTIPLSFLALHPSSAATAESSLESGTAVRRMAPRFTLPIREGGTVALDSLRGKVVFVDFWASWCGPCKKSFPWLRALHDRFGSKGLVIVAINLDKKRSAAEEFLDEIPAPFLVAFDPSGKTAEDFRVSAMPSSFLIGRSGEILYTHAGFDPKKAEMIEGLVEEAIAK